MPVKKSAQKKKSVKKTAVKKKPKMVCKVCGFAVTVDTACGCMDEHPLICCGMPMTPK